MLKKQLFCDVCGEEMTDRRAGSTDYGLFQWNDKKPPLVITKECSLNLDCATRMTIKAINLGKQNHWMTDKLIKQK